MGIVKEEKESLHSLDGIDRLHQRHKTSFQLMCSDHNL